MDFIKKNSQYNILLYLIAIGLVFALLEGFGLVSPIRSFIQKISIPIQISLDQTKNNTRNIFSTLSDAIELRDKNAHLGEKNALLRAENERLKSLESENKILREQLGVSKLKKEVLFVAKKIGFSPLATKKLLLIDKGETSGIKEGMIVVVKNILIGRIFEVSPHVSSVQLISDPDTKIPAITQGKVRGIIQGQFGAEIELRNVVQGEKLSVGELVLTSGESGYPAGLVIGEIKEVKKVEKELFQKATITTLISEDNLTTVFVVGEK